MTSRDIFGYAAGLQENQEIIPYARGGLSNPGNFKDFAWNAGAAIPNEIFGKGLMAPTSDVVRMAAAAAQGQPPPNYNTLDSGATKLGYNAMGIGQEQTPQAALQAASPILTALALKGAIRGLMGKSIITGQLRDVKGRYASPGQTKPTFYNDKWKGQIKSSEAAQRAAKIIDNASKVPGKVSPL